MSTFQRLTLIGLSEYEAQYGRDLFSTLVLPTGYDRTTFINALLLEHGEKCVMYTNPEFMRQSIGIWSAKWALELEKIYEALSAEYNPIWNYDRNEEWKDGSGRKIDTTTNQGRKLTDKPKYDDDITNDYDVVTKQDYNGEVEHQVSADNSGTYQPESKDISNDGQSTTSNDGTIKRHIEGTTQDIAETSNGKENVAETANSNHTGHMWGNIGVTTAAAMVDEVVQQRYTRNLYALATRLFANELLVGLW